MSDPYKESASYCTCPTCDCPSAIPYLGAPPGTGLILYGEPLMLAIAQPCNCCFDPPILLAGGCCGSGGVGVPGLPDPTPRPIYA